MKKRPVIYSIILMVLLLSMLLGCMVSCKNNSEEENNDTTANTDPSEVESKEIDYMTQLPEGTYDGETLTFLVMDSTAKYMFGDFDKQTLNDVARQEVVLMNSFIEDTYDIEFDYIYTIADKTDFMAKFEQASLGAIDVDIACPTFYFGTEFTGNVRNMLDYSDIIQFDNPYWLSGWNDQATINGKLYNPASVNAGNLGDKLTVTYVNDFKARSLEITDDMYQLVRDQKWTLEQMKQYIRIAASDKNQDASYTLDSNDEFGLIYNLFSGRGFVAGVGIKLGYMEEENLVIDLTSGTDAFQDLYLFLHGEGNLYFSGSGGGAIAEEAAAARNAFCVGRALFLADRLMQSEQLGSSMDSYSVLPMPKRNEAQEDYISYYTGIQTTQIMTNSQKDRMAATILEAMAIYSYSKIRPVYYENQLKVRYQSDATAAEMIDLIENSAVIDPLFIFGGKFNVVDSPFNYIVNKNPNFTSSLAQRKDALDVALQELRIFYGLEEAVA